MNIGCAQLMSPVLLHGHTLSHVHGHQKAALSSLWQPECLRLVFRILGVTSPRTNPLANSLGSSDPPPSQSVQFSFSQSRAPVVKLWLRSLVF